MTARMGHDDHFYNEMTPELILRFLAQTPLGEVQERLPSPDLGTYIASEFGTSDCLSPGSQEAAEAATSDETIRRGAMWTWRRLTLPERAILEGLLRDPEDIFELRGRAEGRI